MTKYTVAIAYPLWKSSQYAPAFQYPDGRIETFSPTSFEESRALEIAQVMLAKSHFPTMTKHTPGPWKCVPDGSNKLLVYSNSRYIAKVDNWSNADCADQYKDINQALLDEAKSNAALIAAAPELLSACEGLLDILEQFGASRQMRGIVAAKEAITKATNKP